MVEVLLDELLSVYTPGQLQRLVELTREVVKRGGHGEVIITIKNRQPRFIGLRTSEDFLTIDPIEERT